MISSHLNTGNPLLLLVLNPWISCSRSGCYSNNLRNNAVRWRISIAELFLPKATWPLNRLWIKSSNYVNNSSGGAWVRSLNRGWRCDQNLQILMLRRSLPFGMFLLLILRNVSVVMYSRVDLNRGNARYSGNPAHPTTLSG